MTQTTRQLEHARDTISRVLTPAGKKPEVDLALEHAHAWWDERLPHHEMRRTDSPELRFSVCHYSGCTDRDRPEVGASCMLDTEAKLDHVFDYVRGFVRTHV